MVTVIGGEAYEVGGTLHLEPIATIPSDATPYVFSESDVIDFSYSDNREQTIKTQQVLINPITDDLYSENTILLDFDSELAKGVLLFNPSLSLGALPVIAGAVSSAQFTAEQVETYALLEDTSIVTKGGIDSIVYITLNGEPVLVTDYTMYVGYSIVRFHAPLTGEIEIKYQTRAISVYSNTDTIISVTYLCAQLIAEVTVTGGSYSAPDTVEITDPITTDEGGAIQVAPACDVTFIFAEAKGAENLVTYKVQDLVGGGVLTIKYLYVDTDWTDTSFMDNITSELVNAIEVFSGTVIADSTLGLNVVYLDKPIIDINDVFYGSQGLTGYTYVSADPPYITFASTDVGKDVEISANVELVEITVPPMGSAHDGVILDIISCGDGSGVTSSDEIGSSEVDLCSLPATFKINVAGAFGLEISDVVGVVLTGDLGNLTVDSLGEVEVSITTQGVFTIACDAIIADGVITVNSEGVV